MSKKKLQSSSPANWWDLLGNRRVEPIEDPANATSIDGYAVVAGDGYAAGIIACVMIGAGRSADEAQRLAKKIAGDPSMLDGLTLDVSIRDWRREDMPRVSVHPLEAGVESSAYWDLLQEVKEFTDRAPSHPDLKPLQLIASKINGYHDYDKEPPYALLEDARGVIWRMPEADRRAVLNGWTHPQKDGRNTRDDVEKATTQTTVFFGLLIEADQKKTSAEISQWCTDTINPVQVRIRIGTSQADAMAGLANVVAMVRSRWNDLIAIGEVDKCITAKATGAGSTMESDDGTDKGSDGASVESSLPAGTGSDDAQDRRPHAE